MNINGILIIDKPAGWTSHDVVAKLRSALNQKRIGHGGTLDPMATGVLPIFLGRATRAAEFCENAEKEYIAGLRFGITTDTQDITGEVLGETDCTVTVDEVKAVLPRFLGEQKQMPPMYSAIKQNGKKLYELARQGIEVDRPARDITISAIEVVEDYAETVRQLRHSEGACDRSNQLRHSEGTRDRINQLRHCEGARDRSNPETHLYIRVACSKGTYIRTLCHDIGNVLGCGAAMSYLRRTKAGNFGIDSAHPLDEVIENLDLLLPTDSIFTEYPKIHLCVTDTHRAKNGSLQKLSHIDGGKLTHGWQIPAERNTADGKYRFYSTDDEFLLLGEMKNNKFQLIKSFFEV